MVVLPSGPIGEDGGWLRPEPRCTYQTADHETAEAQNGRNTKRAEGTKQDWLKKLKAQNGVRHKMA
jgi:hypothetical protein